MKAELLCLILLCLNINVFSQSKIPESIKEDLVLKPMAKPYESTGFTVEKGATLTILPGTKINISYKPDNLNKYSVNYIFGTLIIGQKGAANSKPVVISSVEVDRGPWFIYRNAKVDINGLEFVNGYTGIEGNTTGSIKDSIFSQGLKSYMYALSVEVPKTGNLTFQNCLIENQGIKIETKDFPNDIANFTLNKCAFTTKVLPGTNKFRQFFIPMLVFAYGTQCDLYADIEFKAMDWVFKKPLVTEWFVYDERLRKITEDSAKSSKIFSMKLAKKGFTNYKQEELPAK